MGRLVTKLNMPEGGAGPYSEPAAPLTTSIWSNCSIDVTPVMKIVMPSILVFWKLLPCMPRVIGRRISGPCCSWYDTSGMYLETSLKFDCLGVLDQVRGQHGDRVRHVEDRCTAQGTD